MDNNKLPDNFDRQRLIGQLRRLPLQEVPENLAESVMARIAATKRPGLLQRWLPRLNHPVAVAIRPLSAFGVLALLGLAFLLGRLSAPPPSETLSPATSNHTASAYEFEDAEAAFLVGRGLLTAKQKEQGLALLARAADLAPTNPKYALWEGIAHWSNGNREQEKISYQRGLRFAPDSLPLLINLGHHFFSTGQLHEALDMYRAVLTIAPDETIAWYNSGLIYRELGLTVEEVAAWKEFLYRNRTGSQAFRAVERLNDYGDFSYRSYWIGPRRVILRPALLLASEVSDGEKRLEVAVLADLLEQNRDLTLEVAAFAEADRDQARNRGLQIKRLIASAADTMLADRIEVSWFDTPEIIKTRDTEKLELAQSLLFFGKMNRNTINHNKEISI